jgi:RNA-binding protein 25
MNNINPLNNQSQPDNANNNSGNPSNPQNTQMKMPMMGIPVIFSPFLYNTQDQTPVGEKCKIWVGKIPEGISETFIKKLLECCGQIASWHRTTNSSGKLNSFGFCEYSTVESILKCLRLLNGYPLGNSELQIKIGKDTEEYLKKWRERKKIEWINSLTMQGIPVNLEEIKKKEENGEPLEWELKLVSNDQEILKTINEVVSQRQAIDSSGKPISIEKDIFFKNLTDIASSNILENAREKERKRKKEEKKKKFEKLFQDFEKIG